MAGPHARQGTHLLVFQYGPAFVSRFCQIARPHAPACAFTCLPVWACICLSVLPDCQAACSCVRIYLSPSMGLHLSLGSARLPGRMLLRAHLLVSQYGPAFVSRFCLIAGPDARQCAHKLIFPCFSLVHKHKRAHCRRMLARKCVRCSLSVRKRPRWRARLFLAQCVLESFVCVCAEWQRTLPPKPFSVAAGGQRTLWVALPNEDRPELS